MTVCLNCPHFVQTTDFSQKIRRKGGSDNTNKYKIVFVSSCQKKEEKKHKWFSLVCTEDIIENGEDILSFPVSTIVSKVQVQAVKCIFP